MESLPNNESAENFKDLGVALSVEGEVRDEALRLAEEIKNRAEYVFILGESALPHITVFQGRFPKESEAQIREALASLDVNIIGELKMQNKLYFRPNGNVFWNVEDNAELRNFHEELNKKLFPLTKGMMMDQFKTLLAGPSLKAEDREQINKYGVLLAGDKFLPHITIGRLEDPSQSKALENISIPEMVFSPSKFILGTLGQYGEVKRY